jgi:uncharacterized protein (DUF1499 family)
MHGYRNTAWIGLMLIGMTTCTPADSGKPQTLEPRQLKPCPHSPNCVSSKSPQGKQYIPPFVYSSSPNIAYDSLIKILNAEKRVTLVTKESNYIHAGFASALFGFVDDVEFLFEPDQFTVHVRSASRSGYYDFGTNRRRIEHLRRLFAAAVNS